MITIVLRLLGWLTGSFPGILSFAQNIVGKISSDATVRYQAGVTGSTALAQASLGADVELNKLKAQENISDRTWWVTAWEKPLLFYLCLVHFAAIMLDTTFHMGWRIPAPPEPYGTWEGIIILSDVIVMSTAGLTQKVVTSIWK